MSRRLALMASAAALFAIAILWGIAPTATDEGGAPVDAEGSHQGRTLTNTPRPEPDAHHTDEARALLEERNTPEARDAGLRLRHWQVIAHRLEQADDADTVALLGQIRELLASLQTAQRRPTPEHVEEALAHEVSLRKTLEDHAWADDAVVRRELEALW